MSMNQAEYARHANVHPSTVGRWLEVGRISLGPDGRIDPEQADRERTATESPMPHHQARKAQIDAEKDRRAQAEAQPHAAAPAPTQAPAEPMPAMEKLGAALKLETYKLQKAKAEQANLDLDKAAGLLVERAAVEAVLADLGATLRSLLDSLPFRAAPSLARHRGDAEAIHVELQSIAADLLEEIVAHIHRKMETLA